MQVLQFRTPMFALSGSVTPNDGKMLASVFPGLSNGTTSDILAHTLFSKFILNSTYHVDLRASASPCRTRQRCWSLIVLVTAALLAYAIVFHRRVTHLISKLRSCLMFKGALWLGDNRERVQLKPKRIIAGNLS